MSYLPLQAAYLVGIADPTSEPGRPGLVDQSQYARANQAIQMACQSLSDPATSQQQVSSYRILLYGIYAPLANSIVLVYAIVMTLNCRIDIILLASF